MVITKLIGGLGNQMFQYAFGRSVACRHGVPLKLDISWFSSNPSRNYGLRHFNIVEDLASTGEIEKAKQHCSFFEPYHQYYTFNTQSLYLPPSVYLEGYWVSEKYFQVIQSLIRKEFTLKQELDPANRDMAAKIFSCQAVAMHIRRGDYITDPVTNQMFGVCPLEYYYRATEHIAKNVSNPYFFVFSDDWNWFWALEIIKVNYQVTFVTLNTEADCFKDLFLMSCCKHHIIANSTFSWWGAWLSPNPRKIVVAPQRWMATDDFDTSDVIPPTWIRL